MDFDSTIGNQTYHFSFLNNTSILVSGANSEYILYKSKTWQCADDITLQLLQQFNEAIAEHYHFVK